jgi:ataxin-3
LLQGPYFTEIDLMQIAREFDERERQVMLESGIDSKEYLKYMAVTNGPL